MSLPLQITSVIVVLRCGFKYLLVRRNAQDEIFPGKWQNVGGKVELGERVEETVKREVEEEVSLKISGDLKFLMSYSWRKGQGDPQRLGLVFLVELTGSVSEFKIRLDEELDNYGWFDDKELKKMNEKNLLIGKDSPTGTFAQIKTAVKS